MRVGILSFGSLVHDPGAQLEGRIERRVDGLNTPFAVEFARSSRTRDGAPTLVPVEHGGCPVRATLLVLAADVDVRQARKLVYLREARRDDDPRDRAGEVRWIKQTGPLGGAHACLYVALPANVSPLTPERLAELAVGSAAAPAGERSLDGISYLSAQKARGVRTPLMPAYEAAILARTGTSSLQEAWERARERAASR